MATGINQLNHVALHVADVARSVAFYGEVLGLEQIERPAFSFPGAWFAIGPEQELHLIGGRDPRVSVLSHRRGNHFAMRVASIEEAERHLKAHGVELDGPKQRPDGAWQIFVNDPDGHAVELCQVE